MYITYRKPPKGDDCYVYLAQTVRSPVSGKPKTTVIYNFGRKSVLESQRPGFLARLEKHYERLKERRLLSKERSIQAHIKAAELEIGSNSVAKPDYKIDEIASPLLSYALFPLSQIWEKDFKLSYKIDYLQKRYEILAKTGNAPCYKISQAASYLACSRIIAPSSILKAITSRPGFIADFNSLFSLEDTYRCLDFLARFKDDIVKHLNV